MSNFKPRGYKKTRRTKEHKYLIKQLSEEFDIPIKYINDNFGEPEHLKTLKKTADIMIENKELILNPDPNEEYTEVTFTEEEKPTGRVKMKKKKR